MLLRIVAWRCCRTLLHYSINRYHGFESQCKMLSNTLCSCALRYGRSSFINRTGCGSEQKVPLQRSMSKIYGWNYPDSLHMLDSVYFCQCECITGLRALTENTLIRIQFAVRKPRKVYVALQLGKNRVRTSVPT